MNKQTTINLFNEILDDLRSPKELSEIMFSVLILLEQVDNKDLGKWLDLEMNSYFNTNNALTSDVKVPEYRQVAGQFYNIYKRPLIIDDPKLHFVNEYRLRQSVKELEKFSKSKKLISFRDTSLNAIINKGLKVEVDSFYFSSTSVLGILNSIRTNLIQKLLAMSQIIDKAALESETEQTVIHGAIANLHPLVQPVASKLYTDGHFRQAILDTYILLVETVKTKSGKHDLDGTSLMQTVFSARNPIIRISSDQDEQLGFMWMFSGAVMGIRNPKAHRLIQQRDPQRTLEWLSFASVLLRVLDNAEVISNK